ncbi:MAG TPA: DUF6463 family protein [Solirubrobacteraceae bacterium]|jgi:hypothetical protein
MNNRPQSRLPGNGRLLQLLALAHTAVGAVFFHEELRTIARDGVAGAVPYRGPKATAFWFLVPSPLLWILGRLLSRAEEVGDTQALQSASRAGLASALTAVLCLPVSGFWVWAAISLRGLRDARRMSR